MSGAAVKYPKGRGPRGHEKTLYPVVHATILATDPCPDADLWDAAAFHPRLLELEDCTVPRFLRGPKTHNPLFFEDFTSVQRGR